MISKFSVKKPVTVLVDSLPVSFGYEDYYTTLDMGAGRRAEIIL